MAPPQILVTGANYLSRAIRDNLAKEHPQYNITAISQDPASLESLREHAQKSDIVIHAGSPDDSTLIDSLLTGMKHRGKNCFFVFTSGNITTPGIKMSEQPTSEGGEIKEVPAAQSSIGRSKSTEFGLRDPKVWSDINDIGEIRSLPKQQAHRRTDNMVFNAAKDYGKHIHTAIVCPPDVYGTQQLKRASIEKKQECRMLPLYFEEISRRKYALYVGRGQNMRSLVHINDLCKLYSLLIEEAAKSLESGKVRKECWGDNGFYFSSYDEEVAMRDVSKAAAKIMKSHGLIQQENAKSCSLEEAEDMIDGSGMALPMFGGNSRSRADRAHKYLGWKPQGPFFWEVLENDLCNFKGNDPLRDYYPAHMCPQVG